MDFNVFSEDFGENRFEYISALRNEGSVVFSNLSGCWLISGYQEVSQILVDFRNFSSKPFAHQDPLLLGADMPFHQANKKIAKNHFFPSTIDGNRLEETCLLIAGKLHGRIVEKDRLELMRDFVIPFAVSVGALISGVSKMNREYNILDENNDNVINKLISLYMNWNLIDETLDKNIPEFYGNDRIFGTEANDRQITAFIKTLLIAGSETPSGLLSAAIYAILENMNFKDQLIHDFEKHIHPFLNEVLRFYSPGQFTLREAVNDTSISNSIIRKGDKIVLLIGAANRDHGFFPDPDNFDPTRKNDDILSFGKGIHYCIGAHVARTAVSAALSVLIKDLNCLKSTKVVFSKSPQVFSIAELAAERI